MPALVQALTQRGHNTAALHIDMVTESQTALQKTLDMVESDMERWASMLEYIRKDLATDVAMARNGGNMEEADLYGSFHSVGSLLKGFRHVEEWQSLPSFHRKKAAELAMKAEGTLNEIHQAYETFVVYR
jgi:hypothetical protein